MHKSAIFVEIRGGVGDEPESPFLPLLPTRTNNFPNHNM